ncbi:hypothetical protein OS493_012249 [Desmophyllum pertusum]|uniref:Uncharacterized protein n=1 Tax=Desmophyllum pertusum TaxID=174260 RepID=A0A9W9ZQ87_9CNID|nr:hypothetical protein OS493_012249 [Desmophyllum pertusum]
MFASANNEALLQREMTWIQTFCRHILPNAAETGIVLAKTVSKTNVCKVFCKESMARYFRGQASERTIWHFGGRVFCALTDQNLTEESFLKRVIKGEKRVEAIIDAEKQFGMKYSYEKEVVIIDFYYGYWNEHGWPQHV